jgi:predicted PurR-regulated permease PerM
VDVLDVSDDPVRRGIRFPAEPGAAAGGRVLAAIGGVLLLCILSLGTFGAVVLAPIGMWLTSVLLRRLHRELTLLTSWLGAVATLCLAMLIVGGVFVAKLPPDVMSKAHVAMDSGWKMQAKQPRPAWADRLTTPAQRAQQEAMQAQMSSLPALTGTFAVIGGAIGVELIAVIVGSLGWAAALLLYYARKGKWLS